MTGRAFEILKLADAYATRAAENAHAQDAAKEATAAQDDARRALVEALELPIPKLAPNPGAIK